MASSRAGSGRPRPITFGCVPAVDDELTRRRLLTLCAALSESLLLEVLPHRASSPAALAKAFAAGGVDLAWASPTLALFAPAMAQGVPVASSIRQGVAFYHGVLFVLRDSTIRSPWDLAGSRVAWVDGTSASGYIFARLTLASQGSDPRDLFAAETFHDSHGGVARAVLSGVADVGATYAAFESGDPTKELVRAGFMDVAAPEECRIILATPAIPADLLVASSVLAETLGRDRLLACVRELAVDVDALQALRHVLGAEGFVAPQQDALDELRRQISDAHSLGLIGPQ